jgi:hypothetical protein
MVICDSYGVTDDAYYTDRSSTNFSIKLFTSF